MKHYLTAESICNKVMQSIKILTEYIKACTEEKIFTKMGVFKGYKNILSGHSSVQVSLASSFHLLA